jgi:two-component system, NtrC family, sensor kinase
MQDALPATGAYSGHAMRDRRQSEATGLPDADGLRQAQKFKSVGRLAAGMAHEINTPIQFIGDNARFFRDSLEQILDLLHRYQSLRKNADAHAPTTRRALAEISAAELEADLAYLEAEMPRAIEQTPEGIESVATIVRALKQFAHPAGQSQVSADLNKAILST